VELRGRKGQEAGQNCLMRSFMTCNIITVIKSRGLKVHGTDVKCIRYFGWALMNTVMNHRVP